MDLSRRPQPLTTEEGRVLRQAVADLLEPITDGIRELISRLSD